MAEVKNTDKKTLYIRNKKYKVILDGKVYKINMSSESTKTK